MTNNKNPPVLSPLLVITEEQLTENQFEVFELMQEIRAQRATVARLLKDNEMLRAELVLMQRGKKHDIPSKVSDK